MKKILVISLGIESGNNGQNSGLLSMIGALRKNGYDMDFFSALRPSHPESEDDFFLKEQVMLITELKRDLFEKEYRAVIFTSQHLLGQYYALVRDLHRSRLIFLSAGPRIEPEVHFDYTGVWDDTSGLLGFLGDQEQEKKRLVSIVMLTFNQLNLTKQTLESLDRTAEGPFELILVDNGSTDGTRKYLQALEKERTDVRVILNEKNLGFSKANNQGICIASGEDIVLLNNDVVMTRGWLSGLRACMDSDPRIGLAAPMANVAAGVQKVFAPEYNVKNYLEKFAMAWKIQHAGEWIDANRVN
ncbi:MAG TPA: glycosyltransferase family 2 protein, partial [bacterium]|nr:glycosyltransferase family 2 protein [bacterium]